VLKIAEGWTFFPQVNALILFGVSIREVFERRTGEGTEVVNETRQNAGRGTMYEIADPLAHAPASAVAGIPQIVSAMELGRDLGSGQDAIFGQWSDAGQQAIRELEDIRQVSARLFPSKLPQLASLAYAGVCVEARQAGGDFYDFFDRGPRRLGFVVGDVSGKGMASAMVRATLQASLRTLCSVGIQDLDTSLALVNRLLFDSTPEAMYATLFFADYDENTRRLRYVNCGHPAPLLYSHKGLSHLESTARVLGLFSDWKCSLGEVQLRAGDTLLVYTDGITEVTDGAGEEFGEARLLAMLKAQNVPLSVLLQQCMHEVCRFGASDQRDDLTLVALRGLEL
jgi:phosphoserine phosphatase RsbU/P